VVVLDRPRHEQLLSDIRSAGARVKLISDGDVSASIDAALHGRDVDKVYTTQNLIDSDNVFFTATGVSSGELLKGVRYFSGGAQTQPIAMRYRSGTVRWIDAWHNFGRLDKLSFFELH